MGLTLVGRKVWPMIKMARMLAAMNKAAMVCVCVYVCVRAYVYKK